LVFKPSLNLGGWTFRKELEEQTDRMYEYAFGLGLDAPRKNITSNLKMGQNKYLKDQGDDSSKLFARLNVFYRPASVPVLDRCLVFLRAYVNDFDYDAVDRDFRENSLTMGMNIQL
jgi:hypothetical protein